MHFVAQSIVVSNTLRSHGSGAALNRGRSKQAVDTPPAFLRAVRRRLGIADFALDLAASPENAICTLYYTEADDALIQPWTRDGAWGWLNPEYASIAPWVERAWTQKALGAQTAVLVPASIGANWWRDFVHQRAFVLALNGRLTFVGHTDPYPKDLALLLYGPSVSPGYEVWMWANDANEDEAS